MNGNYVTIILNVIVLLSLIIPAVRGYVKGFVRTALHLLRFLVAFVLASVFVRPLGILFKEHWLGAKFYDIVHGALSESFDPTLGGAGMADSLPAGLRAVLDTFGFDVKEAAMTATEAGEAMLERFATTVSDRLASIVSVVIAFVVLFIVILILLSVLSRILTALIEKIPFVSGLNHILGLAVGALIGIFAAWTTAQLLVSVLATFTSVDYSEATVLNFFHDISPLRFLLGLFSHGIADAVM